MSVKKEDFILIDYTAEVEETGEVFDTTIESIAKEKGFSKENAVYEPMLVIVGEGWVLKSLDDALSGLKEGESSTITIPSDKAFGSRDPQKIRMLSIRSFRKKNVAPVPGMQIDIGGKPATIRSVGAGRVQVDFNPPLAGRTLRYNVKVNKIIQGTKEKMMALIHRRLPSIEIEEFNLKITKTKATIKVPNSAFYIEGLQYAKRGIVNDINKFFTNFKTVNFVETFKLTKNATDVKSRKKASG